MTQQWAEVILQVDLEAVEPVADLLSRYVYGGVVIEQEAVDDDCCPTDQTILGNLVQVRGYLPVGEDWPRKQTQVEIAISLLGQLRQISPVEWRLMDEDDWSNSWKQHYHPLCIGDRVVIKPTWEAYEARADQVIIELDPGMAFGTGLHPTTQLCLRQIEQQLRPGVEVLDLGTGSGILAIAAARLGATTVLALDTDDVAVCAAKENVALNGLESTITVAQGSLERSEEADATSVQFDIIVANIIASVICDLAEALVSSLRPTGVLICSGIIETKLDAVTERLRQAGLVRQEVYRMGDWAAISGWK